LGRERAAVLTRSRNAHCSCPYSLYNSRDGDAACCKHYDGACSCRIALLGSTVNPYAALDHSGPFYTPNPHGYDMSESPAGRAQ
jgi:hypothetical protein